MIEARIFHDDVEVGRVRIKHIPSTDQFVGEYTVEFAVERCGAVGLHTRIISYFPRLRYNVLALLKQALETLDPKELSLEPGTGPSDLARRQRGIGESFPR